MAGSGVNDALDAKVYETLVREFGEERANAILGGPPARRRAQVPDVVGKRAKAGPALTRNPTAPKGVDWKERTDRGDSPRLRVTRYIRWGVDCAGCGARVPPGEDHIRVTYPSGPQRRFCPPCGVKEKR